MLPQPAQDTGPGQEFSPQAIVQLIQAVGRRWEQYSTRERGRLFQGVQEELAQNGQAFPLERIRRKWNNLLVTYKRVHERARYTGQHKTTWEYYEMMDALLSSSSKSTATTTSMATTSNIALSLAASLLSLPSLLPTLPSSPLSPPPPPPSSSTNPDPPNPAPQPSALTSPPRQEGPSSLPRPRRLAPRKLKQPAVDTAEQHTGLLQAFLVAQEEQGKVEEEWRRREEERERRRERRERRALGTLGRLVTTLELLSSKQDTAIALLQRLADRH
ncbi:uncharacterized protein LOC136751524 [Amia ocellicauda]|uniref:uncharacterized protein LOC136751524 n=1 Tax=Amia ocellicauda TaxID=2972642 RepID=UPI003464141B